HGAIGKGSDVVRQPNKLGGIVIKKALVESNKGRDRQKQEQNTDPWKKKHEGQDTVAPCEGQRLDQHVGRAKQGGDPADAPDDGDERVDDAGGLAVAQVQKPQPEK